MPTTCDEPPMPGSPPGAAASAWTEMPARATAAPPNKADSVPRNRSVTMTSRISPRVVQRVLHSPTTASIRACRAASADAQNVRRSGFRRGRRDGAARVEGRGGLRAQRDGSGGRRGSFSTAGRPASQKKQRRRRRTPGAWLAHGEPRACRCHEAVLPPEAGVRWDMRPTSTCGRSSRPRPQGKCSRKH